MSQNIHITFALVCDRISLLPKINGFFNLYSGLITQGLRIALLIINVAMTLQRNCLILTVRGFFMIGNDRDLGDGRERQALLGDTPDSEINGNIYSSDGRLVSLGYKSADESIPSYERTSNDFRIDLLSWFDITQHDKWEKWIFRVTFVMLFIVSIIGIYQPHNNSLALFFAPQFVGFIGGCICAKIVPTLIRIAIFVIVILAISYLVQYFH